MISISRTLDLHKGGNDSLAFRSVHKCSIYICLSVCRLSKATDAENVHTVLFCPKKKRSYFNHLCAVLTDVDGEDNDETNSEADDDGVGDKD